MAQRIRAIGYHPELAALPETDETKIEQIFTHFLEKTGQPLTGFIYIASNKENDGEEIDNASLFSSAESDALKTVFLCAKHFIRLFTAERGQSFFIGAARMDGRLGLGAGGNVMQGGLFGLHKTLAIEWQGRVLSKAVDLAAQLPPEKAADYLIDEIFHTGYSRAETGRTPDGRRFAPYLTECYPGLDLYEEGPESGDVLLVTGGGRGITAKCAIGLAQNFRCRFILLGRTDIYNDIEWAGGIRDRAALRKLALARFYPTVSKPSDIDKLVDSALNQMEIQDTLGAIRSAGGVARYAACDVRDAEHLKKIIATCEEELGPVTGLVHGAGNISDKRIQRKTAGDFDNVFGPKVFGLDACLRCLDTARLKYLMLFGSIAGYFGNTGQSDYAMANEVMNKFAYAFKRRRPACKTVSINWGMWDAGSMVSDSIRNVVKDTEIRLIPVDTGTAYFVDQFVYSQKPGACQIVINGCGHLIRPDEGLIK